MLARDARRIRDRESVAGWLMRVAQLTALKVRRHHARHPAAALPDDVPERRPDDGAQREERAIVAEELAALPDKFRAVLVLCTVEGRSNTEAAEALGCPRGTVDSRLAAAKAKLRQRLLRRGVGLAAVASFEAALPKLAADAGGWPVLADGSWLAAIQYGTGASPPTTLTLLADGVSTTMTTLTKIVATALLAGGLVTTAGFGLTQGSGDGPPAPATKVAPPKKPDPTPKDDAKPVAVATLTDVQVRTQLAKPVANVPDHATLEFFLTWIQKEYGVSARVDLPAFSRLAPLPADFKIYEVKLRFTVTTGMSVADLLTDTTTQMTYNQSDQNASPVGISYRIRDGVVLIGPAYRPAVLPNSVGDAEQPKAIPQSIIMEQTLGESVSLALEDKPLKDAIREIRRLTGANIVVDFNKAEQGKNALVSVTFDDVRLYTALEILGDMAGLKLVFRNNVYYLTSPENAEKLQKKVNE